MDNPTQVLTILAQIIVATPLALVCVLGVTSIVDRRLSEAATGRLCQAAIILGLLAAVAALVVMMTSGAAHTSVNLGQWVAIPSYHFSAILILDWLSVPFVVLSLVLCGTIAGFATRYMHRERGFNRFFMLYALFVLGITLTSLAGTIEVLFAGWELVGLSSVLLVGFFQERPAPMRNGLLVWTVYRISDAALLLAAIVLHHLKCEGSFDQLFGAESWPTSATTLSEGNAILLGSLFLIAAAGKSALAPFCGWLPRAMEGPTPSSAIFYGALSVHLGAFLLLRMSPILAASPVLGAAVVTLGLVTALYAYLAGSVQTDIKSVLSFASLAQVGIIVAEIGFGLQTIALIHLLGNACLRTLQFLRAPTLLHDYHLLENALGGHLPAANGPPVPAPAGFRSWLYRFGLERGYLDSFIARLVVAPFVLLFRGCDALERRWTGFLNGSSSACGTRQKSPAAMEEWS